MRAIIRVMLPDTTDEEAIDLKQKIEEVAKDTEGATVEITILPR